MAVAGSAFVRDAVAYEVVGSGPPTIVVNWGWFSNIEAFHEVPGYSAFIERLATIGRVVTFDVRGMGASRGSLGTFDERLDDLAAVVEEVAGEPVVAFGASSGGALAIAFAAKHPELVEKLVLYAAYPRLTQAEQLPMANPELMVAIRKGLGRWGDGSSVGPLAPSVGVRADGRDLWSRVERACIDPEDALASFDVDATIDVVPALGDVRAPTLVIHRVNEQFVPPQVARYLANRISGAELALLDGLDHYPWLSKPEVVLGVLSSFIAGRAIDPPPLQSVLLTDIAGSTEQLLSLGDARWNEKMDEHDRVTREIVDASDGRLVKLTGDGALALFDRPSDSLRCAVVLRERLREADLQIRCGVTVGDVSRRGDDIGGLSVHIAERIAKLAQPGQIFVSRGVTVVLSESRFAWMGTRRFRGVPADRSVFELR